MKSQHQEILSVRHHNNDTAHHYLQCKLGSGIYYVLSVKTGPVAIGQFRNALHKLCATKAMSWHDIMSEVNEACQECSSSDTPLVIQDRVVGK